MCRIHGNVGMKMIVDGSGHRSIIMHKQLKWATSGYGKGQKKGAKWVKHWPSVFGGKSGPKTASCGHGLIYTYNERGIPCVAARVLLLTLFSSVFIRYHLYI